METEMKVKERPILFRGPMVCAILEGRKTQTRRLMKPQPILSLRNPPMNGKPGQTYLCPDLFPTTEKKGAVLAYCESLGTYHCLGSENYAERFSPYGQPGERLWVRESWCCDDYRYPDGPRDELLKAMYYRADGEVHEQFEDTSGPSPWKPSIHMPRWACRIELEIVKVRIERLRDITEFEAKAEGFCEGFGPELPGGRISSFWKAGNRFQASWDSHNKRPYDWASNPWVWVIEFSKVI
jgi:hypothetical protein